ncbi:hypothetical protein [Chamaesiphon sp.]|uniref:hypothetical protein n=1 Tax=Chamaesiphon sp. TaxID=2814140 RepID=UPI0035938801
MNGVVGLLHLPVRTVQQSYLLYCLIQALSKAAQGDIDRGLMFSGGAVKPVAKILPVAELMASLT